MSSKASSSLKELKGLREAVLAEEKARTQALLQNLPEGPSELSVEEPLVATPPEESAEPRDVPVSSPPDELGRPDRAPPASVEPAVLRPASPLVNRAKVNKEPALIIPLTPKIQERLNRNVQDARWSPAELVMEIIRVALHQGYPAVQSGTQLVAKSGTYRTYERNPLETTLKIISGEGVFSVSVKLQNAEYQHWLSYFTEQKAADPHKAAQQICLYSLQSYLESTEDYKPGVWVKNISPDAFSVGVSG